MKKSFLHFFTVFSVFLFMALHLEAKVVVKVISKNGAPAYKKPNFDAPVIARIKSGSKLYTSDKAIQGPDGFGIFYKVRLKKGVYAYVLDTDFKGFKPQGRLIKESKAEQRRYKKLSYQKLNPLFHRSFGLGYGMMNYSVKTKGSTESSLENYIVAKASGDLFGMRLPLEFTLAVSPNSPSLFDSFTVKHSGYSLFFDSSLLFSILKSPDYAGYLSLGVVVSRRDFKIQFSPGDEERPSSATNLGFAAALGATYKIQNYFFRLEFKYYNVKENQLGGFLTLNRFF